MRSEHAHAHTTTDVVFAGHLLIGENGTLLAENRRFARESELLVSDVDVDRLQVERARQTTFADGPRGRAPGHRSHQLTESHTPRKEPR